MSNTTATRPDDWPNWGDTGDKTRPPTDAYIAAGWPQSLTAPPRQYWNWAFNQCFDGIRYVLQRGIGAWSASESYTGVGALVEVGGVQYRSLQSSTNQPPASAPTYWEPCVLTAVQIAAAGFDTITARNAAISTQQGVQDARTTSAIDVAMAGYVTSAALSAAVTAAVAAANPSLLPPSSLGVFGTGRYQVFMVSQTATIPAGVTSIRVRCGGGGGAASTGSGSGAGYAHGVFTVTSLSTFPVLAGVSGTAGGAGGTSSFGALLTATGGAGNGGAAGVGSGGDFQASGGVGAANAGGAAAGSQRGKGGSSVGLGGAAVGGIGAAAGVFGGASPFGAPPSIMDGAPDMFGAVARYAASGVVNGVSNDGHLPIRFPFDGFTGGGAPQGPTSGPAGAGGPGAGGGGSSAGAGGPGGQGAGGGGTTGSGTTGGAGGLGAGGGTGATGGGNGGPGWVVMEY